MGLLQRTRQHRFSIPIAMISLLGLIFHGRRPSFSNVSLALTRLDRSVFGQVGRSYDMVGTRYRSSGRGCG
jgi:hypothetical protein